MVTAFLSIHGFSTVEHHFYYWFMSATSRACAPRYRALAPGGQRFVEELQG